MAPGPVLLVLRIPAVEEGFGIHQGLQRGELCQAGQPRGKPARIIHNAETGTVAQFIIFLNGEAVGSVYLRDIDLDTKEAEYGIFIGEEGARGKGVGTKSAKLILKYAFEELGLEKIFLRVFKDNPSAVRSYEKAGFKKIDRVDTLNIDGETLEVIFMELEKKDFEKR